MHKAKGYCGRHYAQLREYGRVLTTTKFEHRPALIEGPIAKIPIGVGAKDGYAFVDSADAWVDKYHWSDDSDGYAIANRPDGGMIALHRLLMGFPNSLVDHRDGDPRNNRRSNLRVANHAGNARNQKLRRDSSTGFKGVSFDAQTGRYRACIAIDGKTRQLGRYDTALSAALVYDTATVVLFGEFARTNGLIEVPR